MVTYLPRLVVRVAARGVSQADVDHQLYVGGGVVYPIDAERAGAVGDNFGTGGRNLGLDLGAQRWDLVCWYTQGCRGTELESKARCAWVR